MLLLYSPYGLVLHALSSSVFFFGREKKSGRESLFLPIFRFFHGQNFIFTCTFFGFFMFFHAQFFFSRALFHFFSRAKKTVSRATFSDFCAFFAFLTGFFSIIFHVYQFDFHGCNFQKISRAKSDFHAHF